MTAQKFTSAYTAFSELMSKQTFIDVVLNQSTNCFLLLDNKMELYAFNDPLKTLFYNKHDEEYLYQKCGEVLGCAYTVDEEMECGAASHCKVCEIRETAMRSYYENIPFYNKHLSRDFYTRRNKKEHKHLKFSTIPFAHEGNYYLMLVVEDITLMMNQQNRIEKLEENLEEFKKRFLKTISIPRKRAQEQHKH